MAEGALRFKLGLGGWAIKRTKGCVYHPVGPRFLKAAELESGALPGKLLIYLWDDLLRHHGRHTLFTAILKSYGELHRANNERKP
ncbi:MAG: hypothetical protein EBY22_14835, partial [Gammaproteobacteria bacterium]|nr:hypothetical protein [Gammaproteobacteria bacterium]